MEEVNNIFKTGNQSDAIIAMENLEQVLEETELNETTCLSVGSLVAMLHKPKGPFEGLEIFATDNKATLNKTVTNSRVSVRLPRELDAGSNNTIVFCMLTWPERSVTLCGSSHELYESRLVGLSVRGKTISGLQERVNITVNLAGNGTTTSFNRSLTETLQPKCVFFNFSTKAYSPDGCITLWEFGQSHVTCSCDHLTYFGVLLVSANVSPKDREIMSYITLIGCSLSLLTLIITVLLFITNRKARADLSMKVHIHLVVALILLNLHFLPSQAAAQSSTGFCLYMALSLHYSLLATLIWMALEGFHLYLLLVRVFNIYIRKYLLKLSVVGWGIPAVIVSLVVIIDRSSYGPVSLDSANPNSTAICYIVNDTVKMVTTVGVFCLVFIFNVFMLGVTVRRVVTLRQSREFGPRDHNRAKRDIYTLLGVTTLLGITWGLVFFSFGYLTTAGLYLFCILNSLQGFFIFLWFVMSLRKIGKPADNRSSETRSTNG
ncbi:adhesion G-protein coupled receptor G2-like [Perca fluviatilis]|nr:adhesion G-protein coupled receptor G2-like [Perca fluviatilis]